MVLVKLSSKNQITIPRSMLAIFGINAGDKILIQPLKESIEIKPVNESIVDQVASSIIVSESKKKIPFDKVLLSTKKIVSGRKSK